MSAPRPLGVAAPPPPTAQRRYVRLGTVLKAAFGERIGKVALDGGYTCPNRDGTLAHGGCTYCGEGSRGLIARRGSIAAQFAVARQLRRERRFVAYFQAYSSTYAPLDVLRQHWDEACAEPGVVGLALSTRPDCLSDEVLAELAARARRMPLWVELGLESADDTVLRKLNRAHDTAAFADAAGRLRDAGIATVAHLIFGLPQEDEVGGRRSLDFLRELPLWGVKIHPFHIVDGAPIALAWRRGQVPLWDRATYVEQAARAVAAMPAHWVVHRLTGAAPGDRHLAPDWATQPQRLLADIDATLRQRDWVQGCGGTWASDGRRRRPSKATTTDSKASAPAI